MLFMNGGGPHKKNSWSLFPSTSHSSSGVTQPAIFVVPPYHVGFQRLGIANDLLHLLMILTERFELLSECVITAVTDAVKQNGLAIWDSICKSRAACWPGA